MGAVWGDEGERMIPESIKGPALSMGEGGGGGTTVVDGAWIWRVGEPRCG